MGNAQTPTELIAELGYAAQDQFSNARLDAVHQLREIIANARRELKLFEDGMAVNIDWIEQPAGRYHDALTRAESAGRMVSATSWALAQAKS